MSFSWSYTAINSFETCGRRHFLTRVARSVTEPPSESLQWGRTVHKAFEERLNGRAPLPAALEHLEPIANTLMNKHGKRLIEERFCINSSFHPVAWKDKNAWCRGVVDAGIVGVKSAVLVDWKTGNRKPENDQLKLFAGLAFAHYPYLETVHTAFAWLKEKKLDSEVFTREQSPIIWQEYLPRIKRLEVAHQTNKWPPKPSGLCKRHCPCTTCEYHGK